MKTLCLFTFVIFFKHSLCLSAGDLSEEEYYKLPDLFKIDDYEKCHHLNGVFCMGIFELRSLQPSQIYDTMLNLTENKYLNFNHTRIHRGVCLGQYGSCPLNESLPWEISFENCIDNDVRTKFGFNAKLKIKKFCTKDEQSRKFDALDYMFLVYLSLLIAFNIGGTIYHLYCRKYSSKHDKLFMSFSMARNLKNLTKAEDPRNAEFLIFHGLKGLHSLIVILAHTFLGALANHIPNPRYLEMKMGPMANAPVMVQSFIVITTFLRAKKTFEDSEKRTLGYRYVLKAIFDRYFRISPLYLTLIAFSATIFGHIGHGPVWKNALEIEGQDCRNNFWIQALMLQNLFLPVCVAPAWYLGLDFQLYISTTLITMFISRNKEHYWKILAAILITASSCLFVINYTMELDPTALMTSPETMLTLYKECRSFQYLYSSPWGNFGSGVIGIMTYFVYRKVKSSEYNLQSSKIFRVAFQVSFPLSKGLMCLGILVTPYLINASRFEVALYGTVDKILYSTCLAVFFIGCFCNLKNIFRTAMEWPGWVILSRLSLASLVTHAFFNKVVSGSRVTPVNYSITGVIADTVAVATFSTITSLILSVTVEHPMNEAYKALTSSTATQQVNSREAKVDDSNNHKLKSS